MAPDESDTTHEPASAKPLNGWLIKSIGTNLVIRDGIVATIDGRPLAAYLESCGFNDGMAINVVRRETLMHLDAMASCAGIG